MGIKNLAFCVCDVSLHETANSGKDIEELSRSKASLAVVDWKRIAAAAFAAIQPNGPEPTEAQQLLASSGNLHDLYSPAALSRTAHHVIKSLLAYKPNVILIERQRWRSGGGAAVQEWTLRVNTLEAMFWGILTSMKLQSHSGSTEDNHANSQEFPEVWGVFPARVAQFWAGAAPEKTVTGGRRKVEKKDKIAVVKRWVEEEQSMSPSSASTSAQRTFDLSFSHEAKSTLETFTSSQRRRSSRSRGSAPSEEAVTGDSAAGLTPDQRGKVDDLADCPLQAAAWTQWEINRHRVQSSEDDDAVLRLLEHSEVET